MPFGATPVPIPLKPILITLFWLIIAGLIYLLSPILLPFFISALFAYMANPLVNRLMRFNLPRTAAALIVFLGLIGILIVLVLLLVPIIEKQIVAFIGFLPGAVDWIQDKIVYVMSELGLEKLSQAETLSNIPTENLLQVGGGVKWLLQATINSGKAFILNVISTILTLVVTFYLMRDWSLVLHKIRQLIPRKIEPKIVKFAHEADQVLSEFLRGQLLVMLFVAVFYSIALSILGIKIGVLIGLLIGLLSIVPYLGVIIGIVIALVAAFFQLGTVTSLLWVLFIFTIGHSIENFYLTPKLIGERIGLHPVAVIFAIFAGGELFGFLGVLLALPFAAVLMVLLRDLSKRYQQSALYSRR